MDHDQLIDLTRRALKPARDKSTDLAPQVHTVAAAEYTSLERHDRDRALLLATPQLVRIYPLFPNIVLSVTIANGELFRNLSGRPTW